MQAIERKLNFAIYLMILFGYSVVIKLLSSVCIFNTLKLLFPELGCFLAWKQIETFALLLKWFRTYKRQQGCVRECYKNTMQERKMIALIKIVAAVFQAKVVFFVVAQFTFLFNSPVWQMKYVRKNYSRGINF